MVAHPIPKPYTETCTPRPQRRHYFDDFARDLELKMIKPDLIPKTSNSTYTTDYVPIDRQNVIVNKPPRRTRRMYDPHVAPLNDLEGLSKRAHQFNRENPNPKMKDADEMLYLSTYQVGFNNQKNSIKVAKYHYFDKYPSIGAKPVHDATPCSLYQASYEKHPKFNPKNLDNPGKDHGMTKLLYQVKTDLTARDLFHGPGILKNGTSYKFDFPNNSKYISSLPKDVPKSVAIKVDRAIKFRKWAQQ
ncbi:hypothetical protein BC833DRAFT_645901 [Globomyces pollinis-pini]|nr:hypothetical protein BC833DRAFT_645901 [Globomyces pollinis-pini]